MSFGRTKIFHRLHLSIALTLGGLLAACLDIPSDPDSSGRIESIQVQVSQYGTTDSTTLKINPKDSAALIAVVSPSTKANDLQYFWFHNETILDDGKIYTVTATEHSSLPNTLVVKDKEGNSQKIKFEITLNTAPILDSETIPGSGDNVIANESTPIQFQWKSTDANGDKLTHILEIDSTRYNVGSLTKVYQSGLTPGEHAFRVMVFDTYGDADTLSWIHFEVSSPESGESP